MKTKKNANVSIKKIIWAVDAHEGPNEIQKNISHIIEGITGGDPKIKVQPVYVVPPEYWISIDYFFPVAKTLEQRVPLALNRSIPKTKVIGMRKPKILNDQTFTVADTAKELVAYAEKSKADLIVVGTHGKHGLSRMFLGSFAESLILYSSVPVLTVSGRIKPFQNVKEILFPTDFGPESEEVFASLLALAKTQGARITLLHVITKLPLVLHELSLGEQRKYFEQLQNEKQKHSELYVGRAKDEGVELHLEIHPSSNAVSDEILKFAKKANADLIAMAARSGRVVSTLAGSITRQVVRSAPLPVWVLRAKTVQQRRKMHAA